MPTYQIQYTRRDMPDGYRGKAIKTAHTPEAALECLCAGSKSKGYRLKKTGVVLKDVTIEEVK